MLNLKNRKVIAFCGFQGSGKDYNCKRLMMTKGFIKVAFADALREISFKLLGYTIDEGMKHYEELKQTELINGLNFRNILENLGSAIRKYDRDFWAKTVLVQIAQTSKNVCISDLRYANEYRVLKKYCDKNDIEFRLIFCDYESDRYSSENPHESAKLAKYLKDLGYEDQEEVREDDIIIYERRIYGND